MGAIAILSILFINIKLELIEILSKRGISVLLKNIPNEFITALGEELFIRVFVFIGILKLKDNKLVALIISSLIFCLLHSPETPVRFISYFLAGLMYGISFLMFKTIWASTGLHFSWNYFQGAVCGFPVGSQLSNSYLNINITDSISWNGGEYGPEGSILGIVARILIILLVILISSLLKKQLNTTEFLRMKHQTV
ncbi:MAG TPA: CPBP family intramembrane metalloprotease [Prolixibacteraceae bacterium]|nr:CPBP family intramembrane metalloprotease [Prolixibacteraceae bacterium]